MSTDNNASHSSIVIDSTNNTDLSTTLEGTPNIEEKSQTSTKISILSLQKAMSILDQPAVSIVLLVLAGMALAFQAGCNATLNRYGGRAFSSVISFSTGITCCLIFFALDVTVGKTPLPDDHVKSAPWYAWVGGILGAYYVIINILTVPRLGAATVLSVFVCSQVIMACIIDNYGLCTLCRHKYICE
ncbi:hypothetical protein BDB01DRAFT_124971 [Pilobolus umbonatus]|nr:hypothetical protein BDB01DRAFT_124971 [Pilobolus umbonatus]